jgi:hypothetical protein
LRGLREGPVVAVVAFAEAVDVVAALRREKNVYGRTANGEEGCATKSHIYVLALGEGSELIAWRSHKATNRGQSVAAGLLRSVVHVFLTGDLARGHGDVVDDGRDEGEGVARVEDRSSRRIDVGVIVANIGDGKALGVNGTHSLRIRKENNGQNKCKESGNGKREREKVRKWERRRTGKK